MVPLTERLTEDRVRGNPPDFVQRRDGDRVVELREVYLGGVAQWAHRSEAFETAERLLVRKGGVSVDKVRSFDREESLEDGPQDEIGPTTDSLLPLRVLERLDEFARPALRPPFELRVGQLPAIGFMEEVEGHRSEIRTYLLVGGSGWIDLDGVARS
jgi:hypothetical protein